MQDRATQEPADELRRLERENDELRAALEQERARASRAEVEQSIRESEARLRLALAGANQGLYDLDLRTGDAIVTDEYFRMLGYEPGENAFSLARWETELHPDDAPKVREILVECARGDRSEYRLEYRLKTKSGAWKWVLSIGKVVERDEGGRPRRMLGTHTDVTERKEAERALEESRSFLDAIIENSPHSLWVSDAAGTMLRMNQACRDLLHVTDLELVGKYNVLADNVVESQGMMPLVRRAFEQGERVRFPLRYDSAQLRGPALGKTVFRVLDVTISPIVDESGRVKNAIVQHADVTDFHAAAEAALRARLLLEATIEQSHSPIVVVSVPDLVVRHTNAAAGEMLGLGDTRRLVGQPLADVQAQQTWRDLYPDGTPIPPAERPIVRALRGEPTTDMEYLVERADGSRRWGLVSGTPVFDRDGAIIAGVIIFPDITERKRSEERFHRLLQNSNDLVVVTDRDGIQVSVEGPLDRLFGYEPDELIGRSALEFLHPDDQATARALFRELVEKPGTFKHFVFRLRHKDGRWVAGESVVSNLLDDPLVQGLVHNVRDITERDRLQQHLQQAMKMEAIGRLAGGVAHDFNNMLTAISGNVDLARLELSPSDPLRAYFDEIQKAADNAAALTRQLLAFSRRQIIEPVVLNLNELVDDVRKMLIRVIGEDIELRMVLGDRLGSVKADRGQLEQVLANLAVNARDAMPDGGKLLIETANVELDEAYCAEHPGVTPGSYVLLAMTDTGLGMTEEVRRHIFEPFFTTKPKGRGTGLGLATTFGVIKQAGGSIELYTELGVGTTFKIYLPMVESPAEQLRRAPLSAPLSVGHEMVLLVEDEESVRELARNFLTRLGYSVMSASSGAEACLIAQGYDGRIDLLMTDVVMPGMNGRELAERLAAIHPETKVLFTSGYSENVIVHHGVLDGDLHFVGKPYSLQALSVKLREALEW